MGTQLGEFVLVRDGSQVLIRPLVADDKLAVAGFLEGLSLESRTLRFHSGGVRVDEALLERVTSGRVLIADLAGRIVALASYVPLRERATAELAIAVDDAVQGRGIGTVLVEHLSDDARRAGIKVLRAEVLESNYRMLDLLRDLGFHTTRRLAQGTMEVEITLRSDPAYVAAADTRRHVAAVASLQPLFRPRSVAVIGASRRPGSIGRELFKNLLQGGFDGPVYPVNPSATSVVSVRAYPSVSAIPDQVDLGVICVPSHAALDAARDAIEAGVKALVVITAGFGEVDAAGKQRQNELLELCRRNGVRLVGPNCMGVLSNTEAGTMNATFAPTLPPVGSVAMSSQSGALGIAILEHAKQLGLGISSFVSVGNKADLSSNDLLEYWEDDDAVRLILLYLESFGNPRRFARIARRVGAAKPIVAVKGGRTSSGKRAAASHTAALASSEVAVDALFRQAGVIRCDTLEELFELATLLTHQPLPAGNRVAILTNAGGLGILAADACEANGIQVPPLSEETRAALRAMLPPEASLGNPVDMLAASPAETYGATLTRLLNDPSVDAVIVLFIPPLVTRADDVAEALVKACTPPPAKPVMACFVGAQGTPAALRGAITIPSYAFPESAARALGHAAERAAWLRLPAGELPSFEQVTADAARDLAVKALAREQKPWLTPDEVAHLLRTYGINTPAGRIVHSPEEAVLACKEIGTPVAVKLVSGKILHKADVGGVHLNVETEAAAADAYRAIAESLKQHDLADAMDGALVQPMLSEGVECLVGVVTDPLFGPLIAFGSGGFTAELMGDVSFRVHPLTDRDADELIDSVKIARLLRGYRGSAPSDIPALRELLLRVSQMVEDLPEIAEIDFNPVMVRAAGRGALVLDARIRLDRALALAPEAAPALVTTT